MRLASFIIITASTVLASAGCSSTPLVTAGAIATPGPPFLAELHTLTTIGSTVDPLNGDQNPYGLAIAPTSSGQVAAGDLIVCNFNDAANVQGNGSTIVGLAPLAGAAPFRIAQDARLRGCDAISLDPASGNIWSANLQANDVAIFSLSGTFLQKSPYTVNLPWGMIEGTLGNANVFYESNSADGTIERIVSANGLPAAETTIASGFSVNHGVPGTVLAPSGLTYNASIDTLYVVDANADRLVALAMPRRSRQTASSSAARASAGPRRPTRA